MSDESPTPPPGRREWLGRIEAAAVLLASFGLAVYVIKEQESVERMLRAIGWWSYPLAVIVFAIVASAPFSVTDALAMMNGVVFGPVVGSIIDAVGIVVAAIAGYFIARRTAHLLDLERNFMRLPKWVQRYRIASPAFLLAVRVLPGLGGTLATNVAAAFRVPLWIHVLTMSAIAIPICVLFTVFGHGVSSAVHAYYVAHRPHMHMHIPARMHVHFPHRPPAVPDSVRK